MMFLDTSVLIDLVRAAPKAVAWARAWTSIPACSEISRAEVLRGARESEMQKTAGLFAALEWVPVTENIARRAGSLGREWARRSHDLPDLIVAASALETGARLMTSNVRDFPMFPGLKPPY